MSSVITSGHIATLSACLAVACLGGTYVYATGIVMTKAMKIAALALPLICGLTLLHAALKHFFFKKPPELLVQPTPSPVVDPLAETGSELPPLNAPA